MIRYTENPGEVVKKIGEILTLDVAGVLKAAADDNENYPLLVENRDESYSMSLVHKVTEITVEDGTITVFSDSNNGKISFRDGFTYESVAKDGDFDVTFKFENGGVMRLYAGKDLKRVYSPIPEVAK